MKGIYYKSPNEIPYELPGENIILLVSSVLEKKTCDLQDVRKGRRCYVYLISSPFRLQKNTLTIIDLVFHWCLCNK